MKFSIPTGASAMLFGLSLNLGAFVQGEQAFITYHMYEADTSTNTLACSDGANGLQEQLGYFDLSAMFPMVSATSNVHWNSPNCGNCYKVTSGSRTVYVTAVDGCGAGPVGEMHFDMAPAAFELLLGEAGIAAGSGYADFENVDTSFCKGNQGWSGGSGGSGPAPTAPAPTPASSGPGTCGGGSVGNGICPNPNHCCSNWGYCGTQASGHCTGPPAPTNPVPAPTNPAPTNPAPQPTSPSGPAPPTAPSEGDSRMIAYLGNWQACPTADQLAQYTHIVIAFAVSYTWAPGKNNCSPTCQIATPPICNNNDNPFLLDELRAQGKKIIVSFGGAGMGGSWAGDQNDCWEYCYGREQEVVDRLTDIVAELNADGIDIDYEYFYEDNQSGSGFNKGAQAQKFLRDVTVGLHSSLPAGSEITHAPMDIDLEPSTAYFQLLKDISYTLDFIMPQYYNGITRPVLDGVDGTGAGSVSALQHYSTVADQLFGGDATRMVFGFCISDCATTGSNANANQASQIMIDLAGSYSCHGGAFFWVAEHDRNGGWSSAVNQAMASSTSCSANPSPTAPAPVPTNPAPQPTVPAPQPTVPAPQPTVPAPQPTTLAPTPNLRTNSPTLAPVPAPTDAPVQSPPSSGPCCPAGYSGMYATPGCSGFVHCLNGQILGTMISCPPATKFDSSFNYCNWASEVACPSDAGAC